MIEVTKLDGSKLFINEMNIQWIEQLPDTAITFLGGARVVVRDTPAEIVKRCNEVKHSSFSLHSNGQSPTTMVTSKS